MNDIKMYCIDSRRNAFFTTYTCNDENILKKIEDYFLKLEEFAKKCSDVADFEAKFQNSELAIEYSNLFMEISKSNIELEKEKVLESMYSGEQIVDDMTRMARKDIQYEAEKQVRDLPVIGDVLTVKQPLDLFTKYDD